MDFSVFQSLLGELTTSLPNVLGALAILIVGWLVAVIIRAAIRKGLGYAKINERIQTATGTEVDVVEWIAFIAFALVLLIALIAVFNTLDLTMVSGSLQALVNKLLAFVPNLIAGGLLILLAWILATVVKKLVTAGLATTSLDEKLSAEAGMRPMSESLGNVAYGLVFLLFLPGILGAFGLDGLLGPIQGMVNKILDMLPNLLAAAAIGAIGWFVAKILRNLVTNLLAAAGADKFGERVGLRGTMALSRLAGLIVFIFVFVPALIAALQAMKIEAISRPATDMLAAFMDAIPNLVAAALILAVAFFVAELIAGLVAGLLGGMGFDRLPAKLGIGAVFPETTTPSKVVGRIVVFFVMLFAAVEAAGVLGFEQVSGIVSMLIAFGGQVLLGVVIIAVGLWLSNLAYGAIQRIGQANSAFFAGLARFAILGIVFAMGLRAMGIADDIVNLAFALVLGAIAVAVALSFGLGGREAAGKQMEHWLSRFRGES